MPYDIDGIIRSAAQGTRDQLVDASGDVCEICISLKIEELQFSVRDRGMIAQLFDLQLGIRWLLEAYQDALLTEIRDRHERELRTRVADAGTALKVFFDRRSRSVEQLRGFGPAHADIGILTVIPEELRAVQSAFQIDRNVHLTTQSGTIYWLFKHNFVDLRHEISIALGCIGEAGNYDAAAATMKMIQTLKPRAMLLVGIAAGIRGKAKIGDTVLAERVVGWEFGSVNAGSDGGSSRTIARPEMDKPSHRMIQLMMAYDISAAQQDATHLFTDLGWEFPIGRPDDIEWVANVADRIFIKKATIASGEKLLRDPGKLISLREDIHGKIEVGEMEGSGFSKACAAEKVEWMVIRGISDFGDHLKDDRFHAFASRSAAVVAVGFVEHLVSMGILETQ
jgi:nucleoside phosphorylase